MRPRAAFRHVVNRLGAYAEWWDVWLEDGTYHFVELQLDRAWATDEASINELKALAIAVASGFVPPPVSNYSTNPLFGAF